MVAVFGGAFTAATAVEGVSALFGEEAIRRGQVMVLENAADGGSVAAREEQVAGGCEGCKAVFVVESLLAERLVHHKSTGRNLDGGLQGVTKIQRAPALERALPGGRRARDAD